jgi:hypothetical protein
MPSFHEEEVLRSGTSGVYSPHSLILNIESLADLSPEDVCIEDESTFPQIMALHVHEYIHYLHNLTTRSGLSCLTDMFLLVQPLLRQKINEETGEGAETAQQCHLRMVFDSIRKSKGYVQDIPSGFAWHPVKKWEFSQLTDSHPLMPEALMDPEQQITFNVRAVFFNNSELEFRLMPGLDFITEGIAYEIERDIRKRAGTSAFEVDANTPSFPYLAYGPLLEFLAGGKVSSDERVIIGTMALLATSPSVALTSLSKLQGREEGTLGAAVFTTIVKDILEGFDNYSEYFCETLIPMFYQVFSGSEILTKGMQVYEKLILKGLNSRRERQCLELAFLREHMNIKNFNNIAATLLERVVFQGKPDSAIEIRWEGGKESVVTMSPDMHEAFAILQSCIHYVQQHLTNGGLETKKPLRSTPCPFSGACTVEHAAGGPEVCRSRPWDAKNIAKNSALCTYQAGINAFKSIGLPQAADEDDTLPF